MYKRCRLEEPQRLPLFIQDEFSVEVCCGIIRALQSFQTQVENFPLETSFKLGSELVHLASVGRSVGSSVGWLVARVAGWLVARSKNVKSYKKTSPTQGCTISGNRVFILEI